MILIVSMDKLDSYRQGTGAWGHKIRFEEMTGCPALIAHHTEVSPEFVARYPIRAIFITGFGHDWEEVPPQDTYGVNDVLHQMDIPTLGACGGHQLIGWLFNHDVRKLKGFRNEPMRKLRPGEADVWPHYHPGYFTEIGVHQVEILRRDPLFAGLPRRIMVPEAHFCEIKRLPPGFIHLARNDNCELQCIRHEAKPLYGTQFHAEQWTDHYPHGKTVIANFFRIAGLL